jgi:hypothetical protein
MEPTIGPGLSEHNKQALALALMLLYLAAGDEETETDAWLLADLFDVTRHCYAVIRAWEAANNAPGEKVVFEHP